ncbi:MAG: phosphoenolpyruvate--protein phosphotransferase [Gammaproteobacteria bacterium]|nr:phosphoenolpyruvate--protein phosphotransferase [Gammaproteobacteria bacterium]
MTWSLHGKGVSRGIALGVAHVLRRDAFELYEYAIPEHDVDAEIGRLDAAIEDAKAHLRDVREKIPPSTPTDIAAFIDTHLLMLDDGTLIDEPKRLIRDRRCNAEWALKLQRDKIVAAFDQMNDPYLRTRRDDVDHVINRVLRILLNHAPVVHFEADSGLEGTVIVADDLSPADTLQMQHQGVAAFVTEHGGPTSHTAILARSLGVPGVVGVPHARRFVREGEPLIVDGGEGLVIGEADQRITGHYRTRRDERSKRGGLSRLKKAPTITADGHAIELQANVDLEVDYEAARAAGARGVGLFRTEFLYMNRETVPREEEHFAAYRRLVEAFRNQPVTIRTLDIGADKKIESLHSTRVDVANPALGLRAVRLALKEPELFMPQLRAIVRVSALGQVRLMIPMLSCIDEVTQVVELIRRIQQEFRRQRVEFDAAMPIGGMIEVPAAAAYADGFARVLDFLSIGTNDLIQYAVAIDRVNEEVSYLYDPLNPGVLRLIQMAIRAADAAERPIAMCGEMAGDVRYTRLLLGLGLRVFSVHPSLLLEVKQAIATTRLEDVKAVVSRALRTGDPQRCATLLAGLHET